MQSFLDANNLVSSNNRATIGFRGVAQGPRTNDYKTDYQQYLVGVDGKAWGWDYHARVSSGIGVTTDTLAGGYMGFTCFNAAIATGQYDPILGTGSENVNRCILGNQVSRSKSTLNGLHASAQHEFFELSGGPTILAFGADYYQQKYSVDYSSIAQASRADSRASLRVTTRSSAGPSVPFRSAPAGTTGASTANGTFRS